MPNFDKAKTDFEKRIDNIIQILSHTYPEQREDAMSDYVRALQVIKPVNDWRAQELIDKLRRVYTYPTRQEHNSLIEYVHDLKDELHENRIKSVLQGTGSPPVLWIAAILLLLLWK
mgnify:CR=1 FL=1